MFVFEMRGWCAPTFYRILLSKDNCWIVIISVFFLCVNYSFRLIPIFNLKLNLKVVRWKLKNGTKIIMLVILKKIGVNYDEGDQKLISIWDVVWFVIFWYCSTLYRSVRNKENDKSRNQEIKKSSNQELRRARNQGTRSIIRI